MSAPVLPPEGYLSDTSRTTAEIQNATENQNNWDMGIPGGAPEGATLSIASNVIAPPFTACYFPVDAAGGGTISYIDVTNVRDGGIVALHSVNSSNPITITNNATSPPTGSVPIRTYSQENLVLNDPNFFVYLKYNAALSMFQECVTTDWSQAGPIGSTTPNSGSFTTVAATTISATSEVSAPTIAASTTISAPTVTATTVSATTVTSSTPIATTSGGTGSSTAGGGTIFGNFSSSTGAPTFNPAGSPNQLLGVTPSGGSLEYKTLQQGTNITIVETAGTITISSTGGGGGFTNPMTTAGDLIVGGPSGSPTRLGGNTTANREFLSQTGDGTNAGTPQWVGIASTDLPATTVNAPSLLKILASA